jgi:MFS family permease
MLIFYRNNGGISRSYDHTAEGFAPLPLNKNDANKNFTWNLSLVQDLLAIFSSIFISGVAYGIMMTMISFRLEANVENEILISLSTVVQIGAGVIFSRFLPSVGQKVGMIKSIIIGSIVASICSLLLFKFVFYWLWIVIIYFLGTSLFTTAVTRNTIMIDLSPPKIRSIIISIGITLVAIGNAFGPILLNLIKTNDSFYSFLLASMLYLISTIPLLRLKKADSIVREQKKIAIWRYMKNSPKIFFAGFTMSYIMASCSAFSIIYGIKIGMTPSEASMLFSSLLFGTIFYTVFGFLCNYFNRRFLIILSAFCSLYIIYVINYYGNNENIFILLFLLFSAMSGIKLPTLVLINEKYKPTQRLIVNSAFTRVALIGTICGLLTTGALMKHFGHSGLWLSCTIILTCFIVFWFLNYFYKFMNNDFSYKDITILYKNSNESEQEM